MPTNYTGNPTSVQPPSAQPAWGTAPILALPADGDPRNVASILQDFKVLADNIAFLLQGQPSVFGVHQDGDVTFDGTNSYPGLAIQTSGTYTLSRDMTAHIAVVSPTITIKTNGYRFMANVSITNNGIIDNSGISAVNSVAGNGTPRRSIGGGQNGGTGGPSGANPGTAGTSSAFSIGGSGGLGGTISAAGGAAGIATLPGPDDGSLYRVQVITTGLIESSADANGLKALRALLGGGGGGGGSGGVVAIGGGGGGGGGIVLISAPSIVNNGSISANGGTGGNATGPAGSGGGGGGGAIIGAYVTFTNSGTITLTGGAGGLGGGGGGGSGAAGSNGLNLLMRLL